MIHFKIHTNKLAKGDKKGEMVEAQVELYNFITLTYPDYKNDKAKTIIETLSLRDKLFESLLRFRRLNDEYRNGNKSKEDIIKLTKHILQRIMPLIN